MNMAHEESQDLQDSTPSGMSMKLPSKRATRKFLALIWDAALMI